MARPDAKGRFGHWAHGSPSEIFPVTYTGGEFSVPEACRMIMVTTAGDVAVEHTDGQDEALPALQPCVQYIFQAAKILEAGTGATGIKVLR